MWGMMMVIDNDIIKALELVPHCNVYSGECKKCPYRWVDDCATKFPKDALDLINRQKAEIERLKERCSKCGEKTTKTILHLQETLAERNAEIEEQDQAIINALKRMGQIRAEAITEFAERLCEGRVSNDPVVIAVKVELEMMKEGVKNA
jgi:hypothetical protein